MPYFWACSASGNFFFYALRFFFFSVLSIFSSDFYSSIVSILFSTYDVMLCNSSSCFSSSFSFSSSSFSSSSSSSSYCFFSALCASFSSLFV
jgi:hypothetical protein